eukprot:361082-Chlamydomonas_euryale.AAC.8
MWLAMPRGQQSGKERRLPSAHDAMVSNPGPVPLEGHHVQHGINKRLLPACLCSAHVRAPTRCVRLPHMSFQSYSLFVAAHQHCACCTCLKKGCISTWLTAGRMVQPCRARQRGGLTPTTCVTAAMGGPVFGPVHQAAILLHLA